MLQRDSNSRVEREGRRNAPTLKTRIALTAAGFALAVALLLLGTGWFVLAHAIRCQTETTSRSMAVLMANRLGPSMTSTSSQSTRDVLAVLFHADEVTFASVAASDGKVVSELGDAPPGYRPEPAADVRVRKFADVLVAEAPVLDASNRPIGTLHLGYSLAAAVRHFYGLLWFWAVETLLLTLAVFLIGRADAARISRSLLSLAAAVRRMGRDRRTFRLAVRREDEIGAVIRSFNEMAVRLRRYRRQITRQNRELERTVGERTEELLRKNLELAVQNEHVREASRLKSEFLANMSHELRTPLNAILALSELLRDEITGPLANEEQRTQAAMIHHSGEGLLRLINDVLDLSKIEAGRMEVVYAPTDVSRLVRGAVEQIRPLSDRKRLELRAVIADGPEVWIDPDRVHQVLLNLLGNAVKFTDRGSVEVRASIDADRARLTVSVIDTGVGIAPQDHATVFKEFYQVDGSATRRHGGTGLGLAISRRLVWLMGGELDLVSDLGQGSTFRFEVPAFRTRPTELPKTTEEDPAGLFLKIASSDLAATGGAADHPAPVESEGLRRKAGRPATIRILIADGDPDTLQAVSRAFAAERLEILAARTGAETLVELDRARPNLLVLDPALPGLSVSEVLERACAASGRPAVPVIVYAAKELTREQWIALEGRVERILSKGKEGSSLLVEAIRRTADDLGADSDRTGDERRVA